MKKRSYQSLQNRKENRFLEGRVMGHGGNRVYGGTRESFSAPISPEPRHQDFPTAADWDGYHKADPKRDSQLRARWETAIGLAGLLCLILATILGIHAWWLAVIGGISLVILTLITILERSGTATE